MTFNQDEFTKKVIKSMEEKLAYHQMLARHTKQSVRLKKHLTNIRLWKETIEDYKEEYGLQ
ncbi:hypothetical protein [Bacillus infantis]|uniref:hypothetical protein n=1 Tax=Bacillus infantis TaxID=324767 RepID=UPI003CFABED8